MKLTEKQQKELMEFVQAVSSNGFAYAAENYPPDDEELCKVLKLDAVREAQEALESLMKEHDLEFS